MFAPPVAAASSELYPPCHTVVEQHTEVSESTLSLLGFPEEFPYEYDSFSAYTSPGDSTETEDETSDDEDDFLAGLTRRLALSTQRLPSPPSLVTNKTAEGKPANSPESTLSGLGSLTTSGNKSPNGPFSQVASPPESPCGKEDSLKVISAAAGEVAKIKKAKFDAKPNSRPPNPNLNSFIPFPQNAAFCGYYYWPWQPQIYQSPIRFESTLQPALIASPYPVIGVFAAATAAKQPSTGTGVFIPQKPQNPSDSRKKSGGKCVKFPTKVVQTQHPKNEKVSGRCQSRSQARPSAGRSKLDHGNDSNNPKSAVTGGGRKTSSTRKGCTKLKI